MKYLPEKTFREVLDAGVWFLLMWITTSLTNSSSANIGPPSSGGQIVAEPTGLEDVDITSEVLTIDLRPLVSGTPAAVEAVYMLRNQGAERKLNLVFASGSSLVSAFQVWLGDQPIRWAPVQQGDLPTTWRPPPHTPGIGQERDLDYLKYGDRPVTPLAFSVQLPPGDQTLKVSYQAEAARYQRYDPTVYWQFAYVLAPGAILRSFGGLDVTIHVPENWRSACRPRLNREGNTLQGSYTGLPADNVAITVQAPAGWLYHPAVYISRAVLGFTVLAGGVICWWRGRALGRSRGRSLQRAVLDGVLWGLSIIVTGLFAVSGPRLTLSAVQATDYGYGVAFALIGLVGLSLLALLVGFAVHLASASVSRRT